jgi:isopentenyldiphosphate isomerase
MAAMPEYFQTYNDHGEPTGLVARDVVHTTGLWHKSAHVLLFDDHDQLYVQRRAADKDLCPGLWDFSVGEHLKPDESFLDGALRGLSEELGVTGVTLTPMLGVRRSTFRMAELGIVDRELQQAFRGRYPGPIRPDPAEVAAVEPVSLTSLTAWIRRSPDAFTPWFLSELESLELLSSA